MNTCCFKFRLILLTLLFLVSYVGSSRSRSILLGQTVAQWTAGTLSRMSVNIDSSLRIDHQFPLKMSSPQIFEMAFLTLSGSLSRTFLLPDIKNHAPFKVALRYKTQDIDTARMILTSLNEQEEIINTDTLFLKGSDDWQWSEYSLSDHTFRLLNVEIQAIGRLVRTEQSIWLDRLEIRKGDRLITPDTSVVNKFKIAQRDIVPFEPYTFEGFQTVKTLPDKTIMSIGEWLHGSQSLELVAYEFLKHRILHQKTRLVLIELPIEMMLSVDRFVQGDEAFELDSVLQDFDNTLYSDQFRTFAVWLKTFNEKSDVKVHFLGTELNFDRLSSELQLHDFFYWLSLKYPKHENLKLFCQESLVVSGNPAVKNSELFERYGCFSDVLSAHEQAILRHYYENMIQGERDTYLRFWNRDTQMFKNCCFLFDLFPVSSGYTTSIYTHIYHAGYKYLQLNLPHLKSMGQLLKERYSDRYSCVALYALQESYVVNDPNHRRCVIDTLRIGLNSLEESLGSIRFDQGCYFSTNRFNRLYKTSIYGSSLRKQQFTFINPGIRMDGIIFLKQSLPMKKPDYLFQSTLSMPERALKKYEKKLNVYRKQKS